MDSPSESQVHTVGDHAGKYAQRLLLESSEEFSAVVRDCAESLVEFELDSTAAISLRAQFISMTRRSVRTIQLRNPQ